MVVRHWNRLHREVVDALSLKAAKAGWSFEWPHLLSDICVCVREVGLNDLERSIITKTILWFYDSLILRWLKSLWSENLNTLAIRWRIYHGRVFFCRRGSGSEKCIILKDTELLQPNWYSNSRSSITGALREFLSSLCFLWGDTAWHCFCFPRNKY